MNQSLAELFFQSERARALSHPQLLQQICEQYNEGSQELYTLTFYGSFASKLLQVLRREGPAVQGYEQMQQSLKESVEKISITINMFEPQLRQKALSAMNANGLPAFLADLAVLKDWMNSRKQS